MWHKAMDRMISPVETDNSLVNTHVTDSLFCVETRREPRKRPVDSGVYKLDIKGERDKMETSQQWPGGEQAEDRDPRGQAGKGRHAQSGGQATVKGTPHGLERGHWLWRATEKWEVGYNEMTGWGEQGTWCWRTGTLQSAGLHALEEEVWEPCPEPGEGIPGGQDCTATHETVGITHCTSQWAPLEVFLLVPYGPPPSLHVWWRQGCTPAWFSKQSSGSWCPSPPYWEQLPHPCLKLVLTSRLNLGATSHRNLGEDCHWGQEL